MIRTNRDEVMTVIAIIAIIASVLAVLILAMLTYTSTREEKCINNRIHYLVTDKYWKGTNFSCNPLTLEETLDVN